MTQVEVNLRGLLDYMCNDIARALSLPKQAPASTVESVRALAEHAERLHAATRWQPIETAPHDGTHILVGTFPCPKGAVTITTAHWWGPPSFAGEGPPVGEWALSVNALGEYSDCGVKAPTHWQPLPDPPEAQHG